MIGDRRDSSSSEVDSSHRGGHFTEIYRQTNGEEINQHNNAAGKAVLETEEGNPPKTNNNQPKLQQKHRKNKHKQISDVSELSNNVLFTLL